MATVDRLQFGHLKGGMIAHSAWKLQSHRPQADDLLDGELPMNRGSNFLDSTWRGGSLAESHTL